MELSIPVNQINTQNVYFVDKKRNIIVEGDFIKIVYSTDSYEMIGLYTTIEFNVPTYGVKLYTTDITALSLDVNIHTYPQTYMNMGYADESTFPKKIQLRDNRIVPLTFEDRSGYPDFIASSHSALSHSASSHSASSHSALSHSALPYIISPPIISPLSVSKEFFSECVTPEFYLQPNMNPTPYMLDQSFQRGSSDSLDHSWTQIASRSSNVHVKRIITFDPFSQNNVRLIDRLCTVEREIIERYISEYCPLKTASYSLKNQLMSGTIKYHSENKEIEHTSGMTTHNIKEKCILKISGVWETTTNVGITMKFILLR